MNDTLINIAWDTVTYEQGRTSASRVLAPEERLFLAVIIQAVDDATSPKPTLERRQARDVIFSSSSTPLKDMCLHLDIDYDYFKRGVQRMIDEGRTLPKRSE